MPLVDRNIHCLLFCFMSPEIPRQKNMFSDEWEDKRNRRQKRLDREHDLPKQQAMFTQGDLIQLGSSRRPWLKDMASYPLQLEREDPRTPEEIEQDLMREAQENTEPLFSEDTD